MHLWWREKRSKVIGQGERIKRDGKDWRMRESEREREGERARAREKLNACKRKHELWLTDETRNS